MSCTLLSKLALVPGCRPWDKDPESTPIIQYTEPVGPFPQSLSLSSDGQNEFAPIEFVKASVSKAVANVDRMISANKNVVAPQAQTPAWWDISAKVSNAASSANEALQSTLLKVIVLITIVGVIAIFGMSYVQAKGVNLAK